MAKPIIDDELWTLIEPLLPPAKPRRFKYPGRKPVPDRAALTGILFVLKTGIRWRIYQQRWDAARASVAGEGYAIGSKPACGIVCTQCSCRS